jgi:hypothetical protein
MRLMSWAMRGSQRRARAPLHGRLRTFLPFF